MKYLFGLTRSLHSLHPRPGKKHVHVTRHLEAFSCSQLLHEVCFAWPNDRDSKYSLPFTDSWTTWMVKLHKITISAFKHLNIVGLTSQGWPMLPMVSGGIVDTDGRSPGAEQQSPRDHPTIYSCKPRFNWRNPFVVAFQTAVQHSESSMISWTESAKMSKIDQHSGSGSWRVHLVFLCFSSLYSLFQLLDYAGQMSHEAATALESIGHSRGFQEICRSWVFILKLQLRRVLKRWGFELDSGPCTPLSGLSVLGPRVLWRGRQFAKEYQSSTIIYTVYFVIFWHTISIFWLLIHIGENRLNLNHATAVEHKHQHPSLDCFLWPNAQP